jgi:hypothetical protein
MRLRIHVLKEEIDSIVASVRRRPSSRLCVPAGVRIVTTEKEEL